MRPYRLIALVLAVTGFSMSLAAESAVKKGGGANEKPVYELPKSGKNVPRESGGWFNAETVTMRLVLKFFDADKKPVPPEVIRGIARFHYPGKNDTHAPLSLDGMTLVTPATIRPPHNFLVILSLFSAETAEPEETYTFKYP